MNMCTHVNLYWAEYLRIGTTLYLCHASKQIFVIKNKYAFFFTSWNIIHCVNQWNSLNLQEYNKMLLYIIVIPLPFLHTEKPSTLHRWYGNFSCRNMSRVRVFCCCCIIQLLKEYTVWQATTKSQWFTARFIFVYKSER